MSKLSLHVLVVKEVEYVQGLVKQLLQLVVFEQRA